jgi:CRP/FNR family cyclic AMP-dependent transcriptional regulator
MPKSQEIDSLNPLARLAEVATGKKFKTYQKNQTIFEQGDIADTVFYIRTGRIKIEVQSEQGREAVVGILGPGRFFGEGCMNGQPVRMTTTRTMEESVVTAIGMHAMFAILNDNPDISELFMTHLLKRNIRIEEDLIDHLFNSSEQRLARLLLLLAKVEQQGNPKPIDPIISQETLAEMIGTTRSRVNFFMNKFRKLGFISYTGCSGKIEVNTTTGLTGSKCCGHLRAAGKAHEEPPHRYLGRPGRSRR